MFLTCNTTNLEEVKNTPPQIAPFSELSVGIKDSTTIHIKTIDESGIVLRYIISESTLGIDDTISTDSVRYSFTDTGSYAIIITAVNEDNTLSAPETLFISVFSIPPRVIINSIEDIYSVNDTIVFIVSSSDSDGLVHQYLWSFDNNVFDTTSDSSYSKVFASDSTGTKTMYAKVIDDDGIESDVDSVVFEVASFIPTVSITGDASVFANDTLTLTAHAEDSDGTIQKYLWTNPDGDVDTLSDSIKQFVFSTDNVGNHMLFLRVLDDDGLLSKQVSFQISVKLRTPVLNNISYTSISVNDSITFCVSAADSNGKNIIYLWSLDGTTYDTTEDSTYTIFFPVDSYGSESDLVEAYRTEGVFPNNDTIMRAVLLGKAMNEDGILLNQTRILLSVHLYKPTIQEVEDTIVAINDTVALHASAADTNGTISYFRWSFDNGASWDSTEDSSYKAIWGVSDFGLKEVLVQAIDDDGLLTDTGIIHVTVELYPPTVKAVNDFGQIEDTIISRNDSLLVLIAATDTNGQIKKYLWDTGADGWDDSTNYPDSTRYIKYPTGGYVTIAIGAKDDDGIIGTDTFHVLFDRPPTSCGLKSDYNADKGGWSDFNYSTDNGSIQVSFSGTDPDGRYDTLRYDFYWGNDENNLTLKHSGLNAAVSISGISVLTQYYWKVVSRDLYGDSAAKTGVYTSYGYPQDGIFWNVITEQPNFHFPHPDANFSICTFDSKLWLISSRDYPGEKKMVYTSTDGISWTLVTEQANFHFPHPDANFSICTFDSKLWLISSRDYPSEKKMVYTSTDGISWTLVTEQANFRLPHPDANFSICTFDSKLWFISSRDYPSEKKTVYSSGK